MKTFHKENFLLISTEDESITEFASVLTQQHSDYKNDNIVIDLTKFKDIHTNHFLAFLELSNLHRNENKSFVLVNDAVVIDELPEELVVVPTLQEAEDMVQMDEIQRDLGF
jgi:hypothetical protein